MEVPAKLGTLHCSPKLALCDALCLCCAVHQSLLTNWLDKMAPVFHKTKFLEAALAITTQTHARPLTETLTDLRDSIECRSIHLRLSSGWLERSCIDGAASCLITAAANSRGGVTEARNHLSAARKLFKQIGPLLHDHPQKVCVMVEWAVLHAAGSRLTAACASHTLLSDDVG